MVHLKYDVRKINYYVGDQHLAMFKTSILPQEKKMITVNIYLNDYLKQTLI